MIIPEELQKKCEALPYTRKKDLSDDVYKVTASELGSMLEQYGYANVLGVLANLWTFDKTVKFFKKFGSFKKDNDKNKIKTIATSYDKAYIGGVTRVNAQLMDIWVSMGLKVILFTEEPENPLDFQYPESVKRIIIPKSDIGTRLKALQHHCLEEHVDLFISHDWTNHNIIWECMLMNMHNIYFVVYCHGHFANCFRYGKSFLYQPEFFSLCDMVLAISETNAKFYQMCGCRTYFVHNPVPKDLIEVDSHVKEDSNRILFPGRIAEEKYPLEALEIFKRVHDRMSDVVLDVVGEGPLKNKMQEYVLRYGLENCVFFHGAKTVDELDIFYRNAACVLFTSKMEGYPMMVLETKAYGLPLVMYEMPYLSLLKDGKGVLTAPVGNLSEMADSLMKVLSDNECRKALGREARESFYEFKSHNHVTDWDNIFNILLGKPVPSIECYFSAEGLAESEKNILPVFIGELIACTTKIENSSDYRVGKAVLKLPRRIRHYLKK